MSKQWHKTSGTAPSTKNLSNLLNALVWNGMCAEKLVSSLLAAFFSSRLRVRMITRKIWPITWRGRGRQRWTFRVSLGGACWLLQLFIVYRVTVPAVTLSLVSLVHGWPRNHKQQAGFDRQLCFHCPDQSQHFICWWTVWLSGPDLNTPCFFSPSFTHFTICIPRIDDLAVVSPISPSGISSLSKPLFWFRPSLVRREGQASYINAGAACPHEYISFGRRLAMVLLGNWAPSLYAKEQLDSTVHGERDITFTKKRRPKTQKLKNDILATIWSSPLQ